jgi:DNA-binding HxlR family transcriptional regulator
VRDDVSMPDYGSFCPVAIASDVIADRWTPLIVRELVLGNTRFNDIARGLPGISRSLLVQRLKHLERKGVIETWPLRNGRGSEYRLTAAGKDLEPVLIALGRWAVVWMYSDLDASDVDATTLMWWLHRRVDTERLPIERVVVQFVHTAPQRRSYWVVVEEGAASVCLQDPGYDVDAVVTCTTVALARVFSGNVTWNDAVRAGSIEVNGTRAVVNSLPRWFLWSPWAGDVRAVSEALASA